jgi:uncharacterized protein YfeS
MVNPSHSSDNEPWELAPANAHPAAVAALSEPWYWDSDDELSPFGNDTGADVLSLFHEWRQEHPSESPSVFLAELIQDWQVPDTGWQEEDPTRLRALLEAEDYGLTTRDEIIVALALAQAIMEGRIEPKILELARVATRRRLLPVMLESFGGEAEEAQQRYEHIRGVLEQDWQR